MTYRLPQPRPHLHQGAGGQSTALTRIAERTSSMNLVTSYTFPLINNHKSSLVLCAFRVSRVYGWGASVDVDASAIFYIYVSMLRYM